MKPDEGRSPFTSLNRAGWFLAVLVLAALGAIAWLELSSGPETPAWDPGRFETVRAPAAASGDADETWVVAVQLRCPHCRQSLDRVLHATRDLDSRVAAVALLVDTDALPDSGQLAHVAGARAVYWDRAGLWRRWGRSRWGEVLCFDRDGRLERVLAPLEDSTAVPAPGP